ncbi:MAG: UDP-4-amino-4,6-dideoxy-N-acetyl-beta-L-altrosamine transaminase [Colwellia sp.]|nr:UDP-4-amino-4,6-dideoxy-N-acetyl-beta-L-altrosamine transaminase [Colwellia sp.]
MILYGQQNISEQDIEAVSKVLTSSHLTQGNVGIAFEKKLSQICHAPYALAYCNATAALHASCLALGVNNQDIVWTSPISFVASANCALYCGATIDFVDIDSQSANMSVHALKNKLAIADRENKLPKVLIVVHMAGQSCDMAAIYQLTQQYDIKVIEDASHAIGGSYHNHPIGSCNYSDITIFSFHPVKIITTGEGGAALTQSGDLAKKLALYRSHGITREPELMTNKDEGPWYYQQIALGYNYRMTDIQAALGLSQLERLSYFIQRRNVLAKQYDKAFSNTQFQALTQMNGSTSSYHLYVIKNANWSQDQKVSLFNKMREKGIQVHVHYIPIHLQPYYQELGFALGDFPKAELYYQQALTLPMHTKLTNEQQQYIIRTLLDLG